jgi:hypothetical protein
LGDKSFFREGQTLGRGMPVEVLMQEDGLRGSKYGGLVLEVRQLAALVQYDELLEEGTDEDGRQIKLTEYVAHGGIFPVPAAPLPEWLEAVELETPLEVLHEDGWSAFAPPPPPPSPPPHLPLLPLRRLRRRLLRPSRLRLPHRCLLRPRWPVFLKRHKKAKNVRTYRIAMDIGRTQSGQVGGQVGEWWVEESRLRPFTACAVDAPPPPPPDDWVWPHEGDRIEVEVRRPLSSP